MKVTDFRGRYIQVTNLKDLGAENLETINKMSLEQRGVAFNKPQNLKKLQTTPTFRIIGEPRT